MAIVPPHDELIVVSVDELHPGRALVFSFHSRGWSNSGFIVRAPGGYRAYVNRCAHLPLTLDLGDGDLLSTDGRTLICHNHGAQFDATTGRCFAGPCVGRSLEPLPVREVPSTRALHVDVSRVDADRPVHPDFDEDGSDGDSLELLGSER